VGGVTLQRRDDQIDWYDRKSRHSQRLYKTLKFTTIVSGAAVPVVAALKQPWTPWLSGGLGILIVLVEAVQQVNQYHQNWVTFRSTCEALKHEKYLYAAMAGPYAAAETPLKLLAERVESLVSQEHAKWVSLQEQQSTSDSQQKQSK